MGTDRCSIRDMGSLKMQKGRRSRWPSFIYELMRRRPSQHFYAFRLLWLDASPAISVARGTQTATPQTHASTAGELTPLDLCSAETIVSERSLDHDTTRLDQLDGSSHLQESDFRYVIRRVGPIYSGPTYSAIIVCHHRILVVDLDNHESDARWHPRHLPPIFPAQCGCRVEVA